MKPIVVRSAIAVLMALSSTSALAQGAEGNTHGPYVGVEVGAVDHHFVFEETTPTAQTSRNISRWGISGGVFAGYDVYVVPRIRFGAEAILNFGGQTPSTLATSGQRLSIAPRYGYSLTARVGYALSDSVVMYGGGGYGGHRYRVTAPVGASDITNWNNSFILLGGVELRASSRANVRVEFIHLDGTRNQVMVGIPIRF
jgi:outer membrane immunogenic protein